MGNAPLLNLVGTSSTINPSATLEPVKADSFCNLLQALAISFAFKLGNRLHNSASSSQPSLPCLYVSPLHGFVKIDTFCDRLHRFATY